MRFVSAVLLFALAWVPSNRASASMPSARWTHLIEAGKAYWSSVGTPEFPRIVRAHANGCGTSLAIGCATYVDPPSSRVPCVVWLRSDATVQVAAHEVGHCLGFGHRPRGAMGSGPDEIADTKLCRRDWRC